MHMQLKVCIPRLRRCAASTGIHVGAIANSGQALPTTCLFARSLPFILVGWSCGRVEIQLSIVYPARQQLRKTISSKEDLVPALQYQ